MHFKHTAKSRSDNAHPVGTSSTGYTERTDEISKQSSSAAFPQSGRMAGSGQGFDIEYNTETKHPEGSQQNHHGDISSEALSSRALHSISTKNAASQPGTHNTGNGISNHHENGVSFGDTVRNKHHNRTFLSSFEHAFFKGLFSHHTHSKHFEGGNIEDAQAPAHSFANIYTHHFSHGKLFKSATGHNLQATPSETSTAQLSHDITKSDDSKEHNSSDRKTSTAARHNIGPELSGDQGSTTFEVPISDYSTTRCSSPLDIHPRMIEEGLADCDLVMAESSHLFENASSANWSELHHMAFPRPNENSSNEQDAAFAAQALLTTDTLAASNSSFHPSRSMFPKSLSSHDDGLNHPSSHASSVLDKSFKERIPIQLSREKTIRKAHSSDNLGAAIESYSNQAIGPQTLENVRYDNTRLSTIAEPYAPVNYTADFPQKESQHLPRHVVAFHGSRKTRNLQTKHAQHRRRQTVCLSSHALSELDLNLEDGFHSALPKNFSEDVCRDFINLQLGHEDRLPILYRYDQGVDEVRQRLILRFGDTNYSKAMGIFVSIMRDGRNSGFGDDEDVWQSWRFSFFHSGVSFPRCWHRISYPKHFS